MPLSKDQVQAFHCPRWEELPNLPLYMDQVLLVLEGALAIFAEPQERIVTPAMINNYVKQKLLLPPEKKKYTREHIALLAIITVLKRVLSMSEIMGVISILVESSGLPGAYDLFCVHLESFLTQAFLQDAAAPAPGAAPPALSAALTALAGKLLVQAYVAPVAT